MVLIYARPVARAIAFVYILPGDERLRASKWCAPSDLILRITQTSYCQMREVTDCALQRLYWACRQGSGFPGKIPDESTGNVTSTDILKALGLIEPEFEDFKLPEAVEPSVHTTNLADQAKRPYQTITPRDHREPIDSRSPVSSHSDISSPRFSTQPILTVGSQLSTSGPVTSNDEDDTKSLLLAFVPGNEPLHMNSKTTGSAEYSLFFHQENDIAERHCGDVGSFLDLSFCTLSSSTSQSYNNHQMIPFSMAPMTTPQYSQSQSHQSPSNITYDNYLPAWPGSLAAAQQAAAS